MSKLKTHAKPESLDAFTCKLFDLWRLRDAPAKHKWAMFALGLLGSVGARYRLVKSIRLYEREVMRDLTHLTQ